MNKRKKLFGKGTVPSNIDNIVAQISKHIYNKEYSDLEKLLRKDFIYPKILSTKVIDEADYESNSWYGESNSVEYETHTFATVFEVLFHEYNTKFRDLFCAENIATAELPQIGAALLSSLDNTSISPRQLFSFDFNANQYALDNALLELLNYGKSIGNEASTKQQAITEIVTSLRSQFREFQTEEMRLRREQASVIHNGITALRATEFASETMRKLAELEKEYSYKLPALIPIDVLGSITVVHANEENNRIVYQANKNKFYASPELKLVITDYWQRKNELENILAVEKNNFNTELEDREQSLREEVSSRYTDFIAHLNPWVDKFRILKFKLDFMETLQSKDHILNLHRGLGGAGWKRVMSNIATILFPPLAVANLIYRAATGFWLFANKTNTEKHVDSLKLRIGA